MSTENGNRTVILIPTYNEAENIAKIIPEIKAVVPAAHIIVLDDNSPDGTAGIVRRLAQQFSGVEVMQRQHDRGFARSYLDGLQRVVGDTRFDTVVMMDADFSHDPRELPNLIAAVNHGADMALGSRYASERSFAGIPRWRKYLSRFANLYLQLLLSLPVTDGTSGYIALRRQFISRLAPERTRAEGYGFLVELKYRAAGVPGVVIKEHAVDWPNRHQGKSKMSKKIIVESFLLPWRLRFGLLPVRRPRQ